MNKNTAMIRNRLSLRPPQEESLDILARLLDKLTLQKNADLAMELQKVKEDYPTCTDFERDFPSLCFALATGVGKTRLMGAFIAYLYIEKGIKNFFVLAPNLTIYKKLIDDFSNINSPKYVFRGIGEFVHAAPRIITGDNYNEHAHRQMNMFSSITINIFNISKINSESKGGKKPQIKRLWEYIGESYFDYLSQLNDLVLLMDESHHYRAERGMEVINELNPILGLELTATPQVERSGGSVKFENVVYEYSLARAIKDGFVKDPAVATRRDFDPSKYKIEDLDRIKLEDGIRIHEDTKVELDIYARDNKVKQVKPFVLIVAKDTDHAKDLKELIASSNFFDGYYADKVIEVHSNQKGEEKDENIEQLISLEHPDNKIEIVIHVNMLKEGWDVTNLYTIIPLRTAASMTLREQTIGRGLRLPYGKRTGNDKVDRLTIVSHDKFQEIVDLANRPDSLIRKENIIEIEDKEVGQPKIVITSISTLNQKIKDEEAKIDAIVEPEKKQQEAIKLQAKKSVVNVITSLNKNVSNIAGLKKPEIKKLAIQKIEQYIKDNNQVTFFDNKLVKEAEAIYDTIIDEFNSNIIEIPRIMIQQSSKVKSGFTDFDLDTKNLNYQPSSEQITIHRLRDSKSFEIDTKAGKVRYDSIESIIVNELISYPEIDYELCSDLLFKLVKQVINKYETYLDEHQIINVIQLYRKDISRFIFAQMKEHFYYETPEYEKPVVYPFTNIEEHNYSKFTNDDIYHYTLTITPTEDIPKKIFSGFKKACHMLYKFDSKTEKDFAIILEDECNTVKKWLRPSINQFKIYWQNNSKLYHPDFVVETHDSIYIVETKKSKDVNTNEVQEKAKAALTYCKNATEYTTQHGGKPWKYVLIPHEDVKINMSFEILVKKYEIKS